MWKRFRWHWHYPTFNATETFNKLYIIYVFSLYNNLVHVFPASVLGSSVTAIDSQWLGQSTLPILLVPVPECRGSKKSERRGSTFLKNLSAFQRKCQKKVPLLKVPFLKTLCRNWFHLQKSSEPHLSASSSCLCFISLAVRCSSCNLRTKSSMQEFEPI